VFEISFVRATRKIGVSGLMASLGRCRVILSDGDVVKEKVNRLIRGGIDKIQFISDFDRTLTTCFVDEGHSKEGATTYGILDNQKKKYFSERYRNTARQLYTKYHSIEISPTIPLNEKIIAMEEWWSRAIDNLLEESSQLHLLPEMVEHANTRFRNGCDKLFESLRKSGVPFLIFSAGLGNCIELMLKKHNLDLSTNVHVVANYLETDESGIIRPPKGELIHVFNKNEYAIQNSKYFNTVKEKPNVILMGDSLGDLGMSKGIQHDTILTVGFLNQHVTDLLPTYAKSFDVVITDDGPLDFVNDLLNDILTATVPTR